MPINEAERLFNFKKIEEDVQDFWENEEIYNKVNLLRDECPRYSFLDGPPYCSGRIHLGTTWNKTIKDSFLRFKSMNGFSLRRQAGWDMHGLPIEHKVEQLLGLTSKQQIENEIGIDNFVAKCKEFAIDNRDVMTEQFKLMGVWMDWNAPYMTLDPKYMESCWWTIKRANEKNLLIHDQRVISWCPRCQTALAAAEIEYEDKDDPSIFVKFPIITEDYLFNDGKKEFILVWTTTPWTLPANMAVSINPEFTYAYVEVDDEIFIIAEALTDTVIEEEYTVLKTVPGTDLVGKNYIHPLLDEVPIHKTYKYPILPGDHVALDEGTGCVHTAPGHGPDDFEMGKKYDLDIFCPVDEAGNFTAEAGKYEGEFVKEANQGIIEDLKDKGILYRDGIIHHRYGTCWRCHTPIIYLATKQWFLKVTDIKEQMLEEIDKVEWVPEWAGQSRFRDWVENARDWTISRQRYWGIPLPVWQCPDCGEIEVIGSVKELKDKAINPIEVDDGELVHRPYVDQVHLKCTCGATMTRVPDVLDVWIDSGVAGWASLYYPQEKELYNDWAPFDFITEGHDQTRGWFYSQLGCGVIAMDRSPYKKVLMHGFMLDENGQKMSKSLGNVVSPEEVIEKYGVDTLRFYLLWASKPWDDLKFVWDELINIQKMFNILWNVYVFSTTYMSMDDFQPGREDYVLRKEDKWIISRVNTLANEVAENFEKQFFQIAARKINNFILEDLSRLYIRLIRSRTWVEKDDPDKLGAYHTIYTVLVQLAKIMAPITPYLSEDIYKNLVIDTIPDALESIHMTDWPANNDLIDTQLEQDFDIIRDILEAAAHARDLARYNLRWAVRELTIVSGEEKVLQAVSNLEDLLSDQTNALKITTSTDFEDVSYTVTANPKTLGPRLRGDVKLVHKYLNTHDGTSIKEEIDANEKLIIEDEGKVLEIFPEDLVFETVLPESITTADFTGGNLFIDTEIDEEIESNGMMREIIRRIQDMRKDLDLDIEDNIIIELEVSPKIKDIIEGKIVPDTMDLMSREVRATSISFNSVDESYYSKDWSIKDEDLKIHIKKN